MVVRDPRGEFEADVALVHHHTDRYDDDEDYTFTLKDLRTGKIVQTEYFRSSYAFNTGIETGSAPQGIRFTPDERYVEIHCSGSEYDRYPLPGRVAPASSLRSDGRLKLEWEMLRETHQNGAYKRTYELRFLNPETGDVLDRKHKFAQWGKLQGKHDVVQHPIERIVFSPLFPGICIVRSDGETDLKYPTLRVEMTLAPGDLRSPSGKRAARLQTGCPDPESPARESIVLVWDAETRDAPSPIKDPNLEFKAPLMKEIRFVSEGELFIRYEDGTHRTVLVGPVDLTLEPLPFPPDAKGQVAYVDGDFIRIVHAPNRKLQRSIYVPDGRKVGTLDLTEGLMAFGLRVTFEDGGVERFSFTFLESRMTIEKPPHRNAP